MKGNVEAAVRNAEIQNDIVSGVRFSQEEASDDGSPEGVPQPG